MLKVSVIVPVYGVECYLDKCVSSIVGQTYKNLEIILVDDGSPDNCPKMCDEWAKKDRRIKVIHKENGGLSSARNAALDVCDGDYITFVDSDDFLDKNACFEMIKNIKDSDVLVGQMAYVTPIRTAYKQSFEKQVLTKSNKLIENYFAHKNKIGSMACAKLYKKEIFDGLRFLVGRIYEDASIMPKILERCEKIVVIPETLYYWRENIRGITHTKNLKYYSDMILLFREQIQFVLNRYDAVHANICKDLYNYLVNTFFEAEIEKNTQVKQLIQQELQEIVVDKTINNNFTEQEMQIIKDIIASTRRKDLLKEAQKKKAKRNKRKFFRGIIGILVRNKDFYSVT